MLVHSSKALERTGIYRYVTLALFLLLAPSLFAQVSPAQAADLSDRVANLEKSLARIEQKLGKVGAAGGSDTGLTQADEKRLTDLANQVAELQASLKSKDGKGTTLTAPLRIVDSAGSEILAVDPYTKGAPGGLTMRAPNGNRIHLGAGRTGQVALRMYDGTSDVPQLFMGFSAQTANIALNRPGGKDEITLWDNHGNGEIRLNNSNGQTVAIMGSNPTNGEGHAIYTAADGTPLLTLGAAGEHGDVLLGGPGKVVPVWEFMLTGFH